MFRNLRVLFVLALVVASAACGDDDSADGPRDAGLDSGKPKASAGKGGAGGAAGKSGAGGKSGSGGAAGGAAGASGAASGAGGSSPDDLYKCKPPASQPGGNKAEGEQCCGGVGVCSKNPTGAAASGYGLDQCKAGSGLKCAPAPSDDDAGVAALKSCKPEIPPTLVGDVQLEGRCVPACFVIGDSTSANLGQSSCDSGSKCVPCYSPVTGKTTGACDQAGDHPAQAAPPGFPSCGDSDVGYCVPTTATTSAGNVMLPQLTCAEGRVCAPKLRVLDQAACFAHCESGVGGPGACIAGFIVPESSRSFLMKMTCAEGELCAPCVSPLDQQPTGACM